MLRPFAHPVTCCWELVRSETFEPTTSNISFVPWSPMRSATMLDSFAQFFLTVLPTFSRPRTRITHGLQSLMGCILPTIHYRSQLCWELLHRLHTTTIPHATTARKEIHINNDLEVVHPLSGSSSTWFLVELEFAKVGFRGEGKSGVQLYSEHRREPTTNSTHMASTPGLNVKDRQKEKTKYINTAKKC